MWASVQVSSVPSHCQAARPPAPLSPHHTSLPACALGMCSRALDVNDFSSCHPSLSSLAHPPLPALTPLSSPSSCSHPSLIPVLLLSPLPHPPLPALIPPSSPSSCSHPSLIPVFLLSSLSHPPLPAAPLCFVCAVCASQIFCVWFCMCV